MRGKRHRATTAVALGQLLSNFPVLNFPREGSFGFNSVFGGSIGVASGSVCA